MKRPEEITELAWDTRSVDVVEFEVLGMDGLDELLELVEALELEDVLKDGELGRTLEDTFKEKDVGPMLEDTFKEVDVDPVLEESVISGAVVYEDRAALEAMDMFTLETALEIGTKDVVLSEGSDTTEEFAYDVGRSGKAEDEARAGALERDREDAHSEAVN